MMQNTDVRGKNECMKQQSDLKTYFLALKQLGRKGTMVTLTTK